MFNVNTSSAAWAHDIMEVAFAVNHIFLLVFKYRVAFFTNDFPRFCLVVVVFNDFHNKYCKN